MLVWDVAYGQIGTTIDFDWFVQISNLEEF